MDHLKASCIFHVKVGMLDQLKQSKISLWTITSLGKAMLTIQHDVIFSVYLMKTLGDLIRQIATDVVSILE